MPFSKTLKRQSTNKWIRKQLKSLKVIAEDAEIRWTLSHFSYKSCLGTNKLSKLMFRDSTIANEFCMSKTKYTYVTHFGIAPIFKTELIEQINGCLFYSVLFDESLNSSLQH